MTATSSQQTPSPPISDVSEDFNLPAGTELPEAAAIEMAAATPVRWIVVAGPVKCGKTTLLTSLFDMFQFGDLPQYLFAGSRTLPAFEQRCFYSRTSSENLEPETQRTALQDAPEYLHLRVAAKTDPENPVDFLLTDVTGELFKDARDSTDTCKELKILLRASHLLLLLDCKKAIRASSRWAMVEEVKSLLRSFLDSNMVSSRCAVTIAWSKCDWLLAEGSEADHNAFKSGVEKEFEELFKSRCPNMKFIELAARPAAANRDKIKNGHGISGLLDDWFNAVRHRERMLLTPGPSSNATRESEFFLSRHFGKEEK